MNKILVFLLSALVAVLMFVTPVLAAGEATSEQFTNDRYIVTFSDSPDSTSVHGLAGKIHRQHKHLKALTISATAENVAKIRKLSNVTAIEKDIVIKVVGQVENWGVADVKAPAAWSAGYTGQGIKVAIVDTGIATHPNLVIAGGTSVVGYTASYSDDNGHGTHVAGIIAGKQNIGVAPNAQIYAVKAMDKNGSGYLSDIIAGLEWVTTNHMDIVNLSLGSTVDSTAFHQAVDLAYNSGVMVVAAAGNDGNGTDTVNYPAKYTSAIAVSAVDSSNKIASFSSTGPTVEVATPGVSIASTYLNSGYATMSGTSMATPFAAGTLALLKQANPSLTATALRSKLQQTTVDLGATGKDSYYGYGLVQGLALAASPVTLPTTPTSLAVSSVNSSQINLTWSLVSGATSYNIYSATSASGAYTKIGSSSTNSYSNTGLSTGTTYYYKVTAVNSTGESAYSTAVSSTTKLSVPTAPTTLTASSVSSSQINLTWGQVSGATSYNIYRATSTSGTYTKIATLNTISYSNTGLTAATTYYYKVTAVNSVGESVASVVVSASTKVTLPAAPSKLTATAASTSQINLTWSLVSGATSYNVYRATNSSGPYTKLGSVSSSSASSIGLTKATTYNYKVTAVNSAGEGAFSAIAYATTKAR